MMFKGGQDMIRVVCFDVWGTLLNIEAFYLEVARHVSNMTEREHSEVMEQLVRGYNKTKEMRRQGLFEEGKIVSQTLDVLSRESGVNIEILRRAMARASYTIDPQKATIQGALKAVRDIKGLGLNTAILGNVLFWPGSFTRIIIERTGIGDYIDAQFYADEIGVSKPKREAFLTVTEYFRVDNPKSLVHVGDSIYEDFSGALGFRAIGVLIDKNVNRPIVLGEYEACIIPEISYLPSVIKNMTKNF